MEHIYLIKLVDDKYYVIKTSNIVDYIRSPSDAWCIKYKPVSIEQTIANANQNINLLTIHFMSQYGIDRVRGGCFCHMELTDEDAAVIHKIMSPQSSYENIFYEYTKHSQDLTNIPISKRNYIEFFDGKYVHTINDNRTNFDRYPIEQLYVKVDEHILRNNKNVYDKLYKTKFLLHSSVFPDEMNRTHFKFLFTNNNDLQQFITEILEEVNKSINVEQTHKNLKGPDTDNICYTIKCENGRYSYVTDENHCPNAICIYSRSCKCSYNYICIKDDIYDTIATNIEKITKEIVQPDYCYELAKGHLYTFNKTKNIKPLVDKILDELNNNKCYEIKYIDGKYTGTNKSCIHNNEIHVCINYMPEHLRKIDEIIDGSKIRHATNYGCYKVWFHADNDRNIFLYEFLQKMNKE